MSDSLTNRRTLDDEDLVKLVAASFLKHYITPDWNRPQEKAAITKAKIAIKRIKEYLSSESIDGQ